MKRTLKLATGVTLLEIMLVLAIASMVIVMSIRYYQNATNSQNVNVILNQIQNVTAAADNLAQGGQGYSTVSTVGVTTVAGSNNMITPYGTTITISGSSGTGYAVLVGSLPAAVCAALKAKLAANSKYTSPTCSSATATGTLTYTYNAST